MKRFISVFAFMVLTGAALAETPPGAGPHAGGNPQGGNPNYYGAPLNEQQKEAKLLQYISACIDQRKGGASGSGSFTAPGSNLGTSLY